MRPRPEMIPVLIDTAEALWGSQRRLFVAEMVEAMRRSGQLWAMEDPGPAHIKVVEESGLP
jgi:hypothetical protein